MARRAIEDRRRSLAWWSAGIVGLVGFTVALYPSIKGNANFDRLAKDLPDVVRSAFAFDDAIPITSAPGYLQTRLFGALLPLLLVVFAIGAGARAIAGNEEAGTLELILMHPVSRSRVVVERYVAMVAMVVALGAVAMVAVFVLAPMFGALERVSTGGLVAACAGATLLATFHGSLAFALGAATGRRATAAGGAAAFAVFGYLVHSLGAVSSALEPLRAVSPWHWYLAHNMLAEGPALRAVLPAATVAVAMLILSGPRFARRDLG
ncbi:MAG TPA: ABC transporter permease subunit [Acidimicrobiales bacterium]